MKFVLLILCVISIEAVNSSNRINLDLVDKRLLDQFKNGIIGIADDSKCKYQEVMADSLYYKYYFRPSYSDNVNGIYTHHMKYCLPNHYYNLTISKYTQIDRSYTIFTFGLYTDQTFATKINSFTIKAACDAVTENNAYYDYTVINGVRTGKCIEFFYSKNNLNRTCKSNGEWENVRNDMSCYPQVMPIITPTATDLSVSFSGNKSKIILRGKITLKDESSCPENHFDHITYFYSLISNNNQLPPITDPFMKNKTIPFCFENNQNEISYDFEVENSDVNMEWFIISLFGNENQQQPMKSVNYYLRCDEDNSYNAYWPSSYVGETAKGICKILHIWNNNNNPSRLEYPNRKCNSDRSWEVLSDGGCIKYEPDITFDYNETNSYFDNDNINTIIDGKIYIHYNSECSLINETISPIFYMKIKSDLNNNNEMTYEVPSCLSTNKTFVTLNGYKTNTKLYSRLCYDKECKYVLKDTETHIFSCKSVIENNIHYKPTIAGNSVNVTSKDCSYFYYYNKDSFIRKCDSKNGWENTNEECLPIETNFRFDLSDIRPSIDNDYIMTLNGNIKVIDENRCNYPSKPDSLFIIYEISSQVTINPTSSTGINQIIPYCFPDNNEYYNIPINNLKSKNRDNFNLNIKLCTTKTSCEGVNLLSFISKPYGCIGSNYNNYIYDSSLVGETVAKCKDFYEYTETPPIIVTCNENGRWEYPSGKCVLDENYIKLLIDIDLSDLSAKIVNIDNSHEYVHDRKLVVSGNVVLTDRYKCNSTYKPNELRIEYTLAFLSINWSKSTTTTTDYCFTNNIHNILLNDFFSNNYDGVWYNLNVKSNSGILVGSNSRVFGCRPETISNTIFPISLFGNVTGKCIPLYEYIDGKEYEPQRECKKGGEWGEYSKECVKKSNFEIDTSNLITSIRSSIITQVNGNILIKDLNKGNATYPPYKLTLLYYYSSSPSSTTPEDNRRNVDKTYPFSNNHVESVSLSNYYANYEDSDQLNMKLCLDSKCDHIYATKSQILVCRKTNSETINWKKTVITDSAIGSCIDFYYYPKNDEHILPPRLCKEGGIWDIYNEVCVLMNFPKFDVNVIDIKTSLYSSSNLNNYEVYFKSKLVLKEHQKIPNYGKIRLYCKLGNEEGGKDDSNYKYCGDINYKNETNIGVTSYTTNQIYLTNNNNLENFYLYLKLCINRNEDNSCKYIIQDVSSFYLKCDASSSSNATWTESLVNSNVKGECNRKYIYNKDGEEIPLRTCQVNGSWDEPEDICVRQTNPTFSYKWEKFHSFDLKNNEVKFEGTLVVKDDSNCLKYQKEIYYKYCFRDNGNNCDYNRFDKTNYCFSSGGTFKINIPRITLTQRKFYFYIEFCTNKECTNGFYNNEIDYNEIISSYNKPIICLAEDLSDTIYHMKWSDTLPNNKVSTNCSMSPFHSYYNGVNEYPERSCNEYAEWEELKYQCVVNASLCSRDEYAHNYFPLSPSPRVYHSPCKDGFHNNIPEGNVMHNKARRNCTGEGVWSEIENICYSYDYRNLKLEMDNIAFDYDEINDGFYIRENIPFIIDYKSNIRKNDSYFMKIQVNYKLNNDIKTITEFPFTNISDFIINTKTPEIRFNNTNQIDFLLYFKDENDQFTKKTFIAGCLRMNYHKSYFKSTTSFIENTGYCEEGYISENPGGPISKCSNSGFYEAVQYECFYPNYRYYYLNLDTIKVDVNETHFILKNYFTIENDVDCDSVIYYVSLSVYRINITPNMVKYDEKQLACVKGRIARVEIKENDLVIIKSSVANTVSFGLFYNSLLVDNSESINNATRILGCPNHSYKHNIFPTSLFGVITGKCDNGYISQSPNGFPSNECNENGKWSNNSEIKYPCFKPTYKETEFNFTDLIIEPKEQEFCLSGRIYTEYYKKACGDVETPFNLTIYYKFKNIDTSYHYLDSFIYTCRERISETIYNTPVCVFSNTTNEITYQLRYNDEIITTSSYTLGCNRISEDHNNFNTSLVGSIEGYCDDEYFSESINHRPIRECKSDGEWHEDIKYVCIPTDYKHLLFDLSKSVIIIKEKTNFCLTNVLFVLYNRTVCSDIYHPTPINIMFQYANETVNNTINTNALHYFSDFLFNCKYGVVYEGKYPLDFCISSKTSTFIKFAMMYKDEVITSENIYLGCDELKDTDNQFNTALIGKTEGKCNSGFISLSPNGNPQRECLADGTWSEVEYPCIRDDYSMLRFNLQNLIITLNNKHEFCINGNLLSQYEGECDNHNYNLIIKLYYQLNGTGVENYYQDFVFDCRNGNYSVTKFKADLCVDSSLYNKIKFHLYYTNNHITDSLLYLGCMRQIVNGSEWEASLVGESNGVCLNGYTTLNPNISRPIRQCLYNGEYGGILEPCVEIPANEGFLTKTVKYAVFGISILLLLICLLLLCCCLLCYACNRTKKRHDKRVRSEGNIDANNNENDNENNDNENEGENNNNNEKDDEDEDCKENCGTNVIFNDKNDIESIDGLNGSISGGSNNNIKKGILKKTSSKFGKKSSASSLINNNNKNGGSNGNGNKKPSATMYTMRANQLRPTKSSTFVNKSNSINEKNNGSNMPLRHFKSSHNVLRSNSKISPSLPGSTSDNMDDDNTNLLGRTKSSTSSGFNPTFTTANIGLSNPNIPTIARSSSNKYNPRFTSATLGLSNPGSVVNSDNEGSDNELLIGSTSSLKKSNANMNENIPPKYVMNKRQSIDRSKSSAFPPPPQPQIQPPPPSRGAPSSGKTIRHYSVRGGAPTRSVSCRIPKRVNKPETAENHPFGVGSPLKRSKSTLFRENKNVGVNDASSGGPVRQISKKSSSKALELDLDVEDII